MSISSFISAARLLYNCGKYEEALCLACNAIDACSAKEYPNELSNNVRYKKFLKKHFRIICKYGFPGIVADNIRIKVNTEVTGLRLDVNGYVDMEQIIYHVLRCGLVHNCNIEKSIMFIDETVIGDWDVDGFYIPKALVMGLITVVDECCEK